MTESCIFMMKVVNTFLLMGRISRLLPEPMLLLMLKMILYSMQMVLIYSLRMPGLHLGVPPTLLVI